MVKTLSNRYRLLTRRERKQPLRASDMFRGKGGYYRTRIPGELPIKGMTYYRRA